MKNCKSVYWVLVIAICLCLGAISVKADIIGDDGTGIIGGGQESESGDNDGVIVGDGVGVPEQPEAEMPSTPVVSEPKPDSQPEQAVNTSQQSDIPKKQKTKEDKESVKPEESTEKDDSEEVVPEEPKEELKPDPQPKSEPEKEPEDEPKPEPEIRPEPEPEPELQTEPIIKKKMGAGIALIIGYTVVLILFVFIYVMLSPWLYYMTPDLQYRILRPVLMRRSREEREAYTINLNNIKTQYTSLKLVIRNPLVLKNEGMLIVTDPNGKRREYQMEKEITLEV